MIYSLIILIRRYRTTSINCTKYYLIIKQSAVAIQDTNIILCMRFISWKKYNITHMEALENRLRNIGPSSRADSAVAGYVKDGTLFLLHSSYSERTRIRIQYIQRSPMMIVAITPTMYPALWKARGIARIPVPKLPFSRWSMVSELLKNHVVKKPSICRIY